MKRAMGMALVIVMAAGCAGRESASVVADGNPGMEVPASFYGPAAPAEGSLWSPSGDMLFVDQRARRVGDTVIVDIVENASSELDANTETKRESTTKAGIPNALGFLKYLQGHNGNLDPANLFSANTTTEHKGEGTSDRSGRITASIGARVVQVLPNGNVVIYGKRELKVNFETQYITVSGLIRPKDIGSDNRVKSTTLADARIEYSGKGVITEKQRPGWMTRVIDRVWPF